eukprot:1887662-Pyramimonas_sp.AAC.1
MAGAPLSSDSYELDISDDDTILATEEELPLALRPQAIGNPARRGPATTALCGATRVAQATFLSAFNMNSDAMRALTSQLHCTAGLRAARLGDA